MKWSNQKIKRTQVSVPKTHKVRVIITKVHTIRVLGPSKIKDHESTKGGHNKTNHIPTRSRCTIKVEKQPLLPIGPTRPRTLIFSLSQGTLFHIFYYHCIRGRSKLDGAILWSSILLLRVRCQGHHQGVASPLRNNLAIIDQERGHHTSSPWST